MKSKTSFFNKTIFRKNVTLYWPAWTIYLIVLLMAVPGNLWISFHNILRYNQQKLSESDALSCVASNLSIGNGICFAFLMAAITGMALYNYLYVAKSSNMIHALPVTRKELFGTNVITGLLFLFLPEIIAFFGGVIVCLSYGVTCVEYLGMWLLVMLGVSFLAYGMVTFCAMLTGQLVALPLYFAAMNILYTGIRSIINAVIDLMGYGLESANLDSGMFDWLSPLSYLLSNVRFRTHSVLFSDNGYYSYRTDAIELIGGKAVVLYLIPAVLLYVAAYLLYKRRQVEHAGDLVAVPGVRPVFRWGVGLIAGLTVAIWMDGILSLVMDYVSKGWFVISGVIGGVAFFFIAQMFIKKNFRVFQKRTLAECGIFICAMLGCMGTMALDAHVKEQYIPKLENITKATVYFSYPLYLEGESCEQIRELHAMILEHVDEFERAEKEGDGWYISFNYMLKEGENVYRNYFIPYRESSDEFYTSINRMEADAQNYTNWLFGGKEVNPDGYIGGYFESYDSDWEYLGDINIDSKEAGILAEAVYEDAKEGTLQKYNLNSLMDTDVVRGYTGTLILNSVYEDAEPEEEYWEERPYLGWFTPGYYETEYENCNDIYISFGPDCQHIINALIDTGVIASTDELYLVPQYED